METHASPVAFETVLEVPAIEAACVPQWVAAAYIGSYMEHSLDHDGQGR